MGFNKAGLRASKRSEDRTVKKHIKAFYNIMDDMDNIAKQLKDVDVEFTEDNIDEYVLPIYGRELDPMEKFLVLGKLHYKEDEQKDNDK